MEKPEWHGYLTLKKFEDMITRFATIHEYDRQMDRQTPHNSIGHTHKHCVAKTTPRWPSPGQCEK